MQSTKAGDPTVTPSSNLESRAARRPPAHVHRGIGGPSGAQDRRSVETVATVDQAGLAEISPDNASADHNDPHGIEVYQRGTASSGVTEDLRRRVLQPEFAAH
jgi:hypothetical protein